VSRRRKSPVDTHITYGQLKLKCPYGHELGAILATRDRLLYRLDHVLKDGEPSAFDPMVPGRPVRATCDICRQQQRSPHYEAPWPIVEKHLQEELADPHSEHSTLTLSE